MKVFSGPAKVIIPRMKLLLTSCAQKVVSGDVVVIRYEGPKAALVCVRC